MGVEVGSDGLSDSSDQWELSRPFKDRGIQELVGYSPGRNRIDKQLLFGVLPKGSDLAQNSSDLMAAQKVAKDRLSSIEYD